MLKLLQIESLSIAAFAVGALLVIALRRVDLIVSAAVFVIVEFTYHVNEREPE